MMSSANPLFRGADAPTTSPAPQRTREGRSRAGGGRLPLGLTPEAQGRGARAASTARGQKSVAARLLELAHATPGSFTVEHAITALKKQRPTQRQTVLTILSQLKCDGFLQRVGVEKGLRATYALSEELRGRGPQKRVPPSFAPRAPAHLEGSPLPQPARVRHAVPGQHLHPADFFADKPPLPANRFTAPSERGVRHA